MKQDRQDQVFANILGARSRDSGQKLGTPWPGEVSKLIAAAVSLAFGNERGKEGRKEDGGREEGHGGNG